MGREFNGWEESQYLQHYHMSKATFWFLAEKYGYLLAKLDTYLRCPVLFSKRLAIFLHGCHMACHSARLQPSMVLDSQLSSQLFMRALMLCTRLWLQSLYDFLLGQN